VNEGEAHTLRLDRAPPVTQRGQRLATKRSPEVAQEHGQHRPLPRKLAQRHAFLRNR
jgi:hypothetical protein